MLGKGGWSQPRGLLAYGRFQLARVANPVLGMPSACAHSHAWAHRQFLMETLKLVHNQLEADEDE